MMRSGPRVSLSDLSDVPANQVEVFVSDLLFDTPWWLPTSIILAGVVLFVSGNARQRLGQRNLGAGLVLLAFGLMLLSWLVETDKEVCLRQSREIVAAVQERKWDNLRNLLDEQVSMGILSATIYPNRVDLIKGAQDSVSTYGLTSLTIVSKQARQTQTVITVDLNVLSIQDATMGRPVPSSWQLEWQQNGKQWLLDRISCLKIGDMTNSQMRGTFPQ